MDTPEGRRLFKNRVAARFGSKVARYAENAIVQQKILKHLIDLLAPRLEPGKLWADVGCGDGALERSLRARGYSTTLFGLDIAEASLEFCAAGRLSATSWIRADIDHLPFKAFSLDGIVATSVLQWSHHTLETTVELLKLLKPGGEFAFSIFIDGSFRELFEMRNRFHLPPAVTLPLAEDISSLLREHGCTTDGFDHFIETIFFPSARSLVRHLSSTGSTSVPSSPGRMSRTNLERFLDAFDETFGTSRGVPLTYAAVLGIARKVRPDE